MELGGGGWGGRVLLFVCYIASVPASSVGGKGTALCLLHSHGPSI